MKKDDLCKTHSHKSVHCNIFEIGYARFQLHSNHQGESISEDEIQGSQNITVEIKDDPHQ